MGTALHYLAQRPDVCHAVTNEVESFREPLDFDELKNVPLLNAFLAEMWRMDPPVNAAFRKLTKDVEYNGYSFPRDMIVRYDITASLQNYSLYPNPSLFDISRFLPVDHPLSLSSSPSSSSNGMNGNSKPCGENRCWHAKGVDYNNMQANYAVFGGGSHGSLGSHFAKLEMRVLITRLLQKYKLAVRNSEKVCEWMEK
jgi:sterol 14alpha-demethylase